MSGIGERTCIPRVSIAFAPRYGGRPVSSSNAMMPSAYEIDEVSSARIDRGGVDLGSHVLGRAGDCLEALELRREQPEVHQHCAVARREHDVGGLHVAVGIPDACTAASPSAMPRSVSMTSRIANCLPRANVLLNVIDEASSRESAP